MLLRIGEAAIRLGVTATTLRRWERAGKLMPACRTAGGHRRYDARTLFGKPDPNNAQSLTVLYASVSTHDQRKDLDTQAAVLERHARRVGYHECLLIRDLGSGLTYRKRGLTRMLSLIRAGRVKRVVVLRRDRLLRFGAELFLTLCSWHGVAVIVLDEPEESFEQSLVSDVLELMNVFAARLHGSRSHGNRRRLRTA